MNEEELLQQAIDCKTMYFDGFGAFRIINGVLRCVGFTLGNGAQLNLVISLPGAEIATTAARHILDEGPVKEALAWCGTSTAH